MNDVRFWHHHQVIILSQHQQQRTFIRLRVLTFRNVLHSAPESLAINYLLFRPSMRPTNVSAIEILMCGGVVYIFIRVFHVSKYIKSTLYAARIRILNIFCLFGLTTMQQFRVGNKRAEIGPQIKEKDEIFSSIFAVCPKKDDIYRATRSCCCWGAERESDDDRICSRQRKKWGAILLCRLLPNKLTTTFPPFHFSVFFFVFLFYFRHFTHDTHRKTVDPAVCLCCSTL